MSPADFSDKNEFEYRYIYSMKNIINQTEINLYIRVAVKPVIFNEVASPSMVQR